MWARHVRRTDPVGGEGHPHDRGVFRVDGVAATAPPDRTRLTHSTDVGLLIGVLGIGRVLGGERVEDELGGGVSIGACAISLGVQFPMSLPRSVAAADLDGDGLIDELRSSQRCPGVRPGGDAQVLIEREVAGRTAG